MTDSMSDETYSGFGDFFNRLTQMEKRGEGELDKLTNGAWTDEMEMMLNDMVMTGLVDGGENVDGGLPYATADSFHIADDLGVDLDISTLSSWDIDAAIGVF